MFDFKKLKGVIEALETEYVAVSSNHRYLTGLLIKAFHEIVEQLEKTDPAVSLDQEEVPAIPEPVKEIVIPGETTSATEAPAQSEDPKDSTLS